MMNQLNIDIQPNPVNSGSTPNNPVSSQEYINGMVFPILKPLVKDLLIDRPDNIIDYMMSWLRSSQSLHTQLKSHSLSKGSVSSRGNSRPKNVKSESGGEREQSPSLSPLTSTLKVELQRELSPQREAKKRHSMWGSPERPRLSWKADNLTDVSSHSQGQDGIQSLKKSYDMFDEDNQLEEAFSKNCYLKLLNEQEQRELKTGGISIIQIKKHFELHPDSQKDFYTILNGSLTSRAPNKTSNNLQVEPAKSYSTMSNFTSFGYLGISSLQKTNSGPLKADVDTTLLCLSKEAFDKYLGPKVAEKRHQLLNIVNTVPAFDSLDELQLVLLADNFEEKSCQISENLAQQVLFRLISEQGFSKHDCAQDWFS